MIFGLCVVAAVAMVFYQSHRRSDTSLAANVPDSIKSVVFTSPVALSKFRLSAHDRKAFTEASFRGYWTFMFFGYTHCPDICPATMSQLVNIKNLVENDDSISDKVQVVFVSVDPARDTPEHLAKYINYFDDSFVAATGELSEIEKLEEQIGVVHRYSKPDSEGNYRVSHSTDIFLLEPTGLVIASFQVPLNIKRVADQYASIQKLHEKQVM
ncbi:MAG: SCO family protein [Gammaproteobacteria bacterium]